MSGQIGPPVGRKTDPQSFFLSGHPQPTTTGTRSFISSDQESMLKNCVNEKTWSSRIRQSCRKSQIRQVVENLRSDKRDKQGCQEYWSQGGGSVPAIYKNSKYLERQFCCILSCEPHMFSSKCKIEQKHILHQFSNPSNVNLRVIIVPSVIVFTAHRKGPACSLNPHQSGECIG